MKTTRTLRLTIVFIVFIAALALSNRLSDVAQAQQNKPKRSARASSRIDFNRDIRPILADKCWACHGPDAPNKKITLRLDSEAAARRVIIPAQPEQSELIRRITADDQSMRMPPAYSGRSLSAQEIALLTAWIRQGAEWQRHWAFIPPVRPALPQVKNKAWPREPLDFFILEKLERAGLQPSPEAERATLLRRVSFDLTGLPPTLKELDEFLHDQSPKAYEKVVDRLLASPRYGERMAFRWLDAARYADTNGYQIDGDRSAWRWRDWVIEAFNRNQPFDQFIIEQLAGDLLPNATLDQRIATAFNRNHRTNAEDGLIPEEYRIEYVVDRVDTTATVFMGLTMGCARCHNHKYDPFTQQEYYQLSAYFNSIPEDGRASNYGNSAPWIAAPTVAQRQKHKQLEQEIQLNQRRLALLLKKDALAVRRWEQSLDAPGGTHWFPQDNLLVHHALDENSSLVVNGKIARLDPARPNEEKFDHADVKKEDTGFRNGAPKFVSSPIGQAVEFDGRYYFDAGRTANFDYRDRLRDFKDNFAISIWIYPESDQSGAILTHTHEAASEFFNNLPNVKGWGLYFINGKAHFNLVNVWADDSFRVETAEALPLNEWSHLLAVFDSTQPLDKVKIYLNGQLQKLVINNGRLFRSFGDAGRTLKIGAGGSTGLRFRGRLDEARVYKAIPDEDQLAVLACAETLEQIARIPPGKRSRGQRLKMQGAYLDKAAPEAAREVWKKISELKQQCLNLEAEFSTLMVMQETPAPRPAFLLRRGAYDAPGEKVERGVPATLAPMPQTLPNNRLGLAKWLVSSDNPLTARVAVNRFWQMLFGAGLVKTTEDFGSQGELPTHPALLDYLAVEFMTRAEGGRMKDETGRSLHPSSLIPHPSKSAWDVKALLKSIVLSATYRQSSQLTAQLQQRDPDNRLLARGARFRLSAEMIRDQALFVSGLLVEKPGGPSVKPYQPDGLWKDMTFSNMTTYHQEKGEGLWRRSLYTFWKRTILNPGMFVFDASAREHCTVRETRTNSPLQALNLMNDVTYVEAARLLAGRMMTEGGATPEARVAWAFRLVTSRAPQPDERRILLSNLNSQLEYFRGQTEEAGQLLKTGEKRNEVRLDARELAAYTALASLILNLDEVITKQ